MGKKKKQFIDKKRAVKFQLVHRDQKDPLQADSDAPERVLHPVGETSTNQNKKEEQRKLGVYYDDEYDYLQHLKVRGDGAFMMAEETEPTKDKVSFKDVGGISLPSSVLPSEHEEQQGMLEKGVLPRGPQPDWDPDIVEALDDGLDLDDPDNILEDDFVVLADGEGVDSKHFRDHDEFRFTDSDGDFESDGFDNESEESDSNFTHEETKSRFTNYSMTSSVIRRTEGLRLLDDCFEKVMEEYDEEDIGELDEDAMGGVLNPDHPFVNQMIDELNDQREKTSYNDFQKTQPKLAIHNISGFDEEKDNEEEDRENFEMLKKSEKENWDCESILSTYSNIYNHPKVISEPPKVKPIKLTKKLGIPADVLKKKEQKNEMQDSILEEEKKVVVLRPKNEGKEEKKLRKSAVKEERRERRAEKKANKMAFKTEQKTQLKIFASQPVTPSVKM